MGVKTIVPVLICVIFLVPQGLSISTANVTGTTGQTPVPTAPSLKFECDTSGTISKILGVKVEDVVIFNGTEYCHLSESSCIWKNKKTLSVLHVQGENNSEIAGGKHAHFYQLECKTAGDFVASVSKSVQIATPAPKNSYTQQTIQPTPSTKNVSLQIMDKDGKPATKVKIGDQLLLQIIGPVGYKVEPINCTANTDQVALQNEYTLWKNDSCASLDSAILDDKWTEDPKSGNIISVTMYGFRFVKSEKVMVTCTAHFCPKDNANCYAKSCLVKNGGTAGRKRRNADDTETTSENGYIEDSISTSFTVVDNTVRSSACSGPVLSVIMYMLSLVLMLAVL